MTKVPIKRALLSWTIAEIRALKRLLENAKLHQELPESTEKPANRYINQAVRDILSTGPNDLEFLKRKFRGMWSKRH